MGQTSEDKASIKVNLRALCDVTEHSLSLYRPKVFLRRVSPLVVPVRLFSSITPWTSREVTDSESFHLDEHQQFKRCCLRGARRHK